MYIPEVLTFLPSPFSPQTIFVEINITDDTFVEDTEEFLVILLLSANDSAISSNISQVSIAITDNNGM